MVLSFILDKFVESRFFLNYENVNWIIFGPTTKLQYSDFKGLMQTQTPQMVYIPFGGLYTPKCR